MVEFVQKGILLEFFLKQDTVWDCFGQTVADCRLPNSDVAANRTKESRKTQKVVYIFFTLLLTREVIKWFF